MPLGSPPRWHSRRRLLPLQRADPTVLLLGEAQSRDEQLSGSELTGFRDSQLTSIAFFEFQIYGRELYRQPTRGRFCTVGTIVIIHRCGLRDRSSWTDRTMPKNLDPFKLSSVARPLYWARRQRLASTELVVST